MRDIYGSAHRVIGWLKVDPQIPLLPGPLASLAEIVSTLESPDEIAQSFAHGDLQRKLRAAVILLCNDFLFRTWIIQEVALAQNMVVKLGSEEILWKTFVEAVESFVWAYSFYGSFAVMPVTFGNRMTEAGLNIQIMEQFRSSMARSPSGLVGDHIGLAMSELLLISANFECTDPRDRIFGVLGLSTETARNHKDLQIDYGEDVTETMVSMNATRFTLINESSFLLVELAGIGYYCSQDDVAKALQSPS
jgi:hypothetical protein